MNASPVETQLRLYGQDLVERCSDHRLTSEDAAASPSRLPKVAFVVVLALFVVGAAATVLHPWSDQGGSRPPTLAPETSVAVDDGPADTTPNVSAPQIQDPRIPTVEKATIQRWIQEAELYYGVSVGDLCPPTDSAPPTSLVMGLSVLDPIGFGSCRVVAFAPIEPGPRDAGNLPMGDYDQNGNLLDENSPNMPAVEWESPLNGQTGDGSMGVIGTQICFTDSNGGRYCANDIAGNSAPTG